MVERSPELLYHGSNVIYFLPTVIFPNEEFRSIPEEVIPGANEYYLISNYGRLWHKFNCYFFNYLIDTNGYAYKSFKTKYGEKICRIHILVKRTFDPNPNPRLEINFLDNNKSNLIIWNLAYIDSEAAKQNRVNTIHSYSDEIIHEICRRLEKRDCTFSVIANELNVPYTLVQSINGGYTRLDIASQYDIETRKVSKTLTDEEIVNVCKFLEAHKHDIPIKIDRCRAAASYIGKSSEDRHVIKAIKKILGRETFINISCNFDI